MPNSAAAAYTAACQDPANAGSKELPAAQRYLAQYYLRFALIDHAAYFAYKCLEHESVSVYHKAFLILSLSSPPRSLGSSHSTNNNWYCENNVTTSARDRSLHDAFINQARETIHLSQRVVTEVC